MTALAAANKEKPEKLFRYLLAAAIVLCAIASLAVLRWRHPHDVTGMPNCPTVSVAGVYCPGCGTLRATHHLLNGRPRSAWAQNPLLLVAGPPVLALAALTLVCWVRGRSTPSWAGSRWMVWGLIGLGALMIGYGIVRNIDADWAAWMKPADQQAAE